MQPFVRYVTRVRSRDAPGEVQAPVWDRPVKVRAGTPADAYPGNSTFWPPWQTPGRLPVYSHTRDVTLARYCCNVNSSAAAAAPVQLAADLLLSTRKGFKHSANDYDLVVYLSLFQNDVRLCLTFPLEKPASSLIRPVSVFPLLPWRPGATSV